MEEVHQGFKAASDVGLEVEFIHTAITIAKQNPNLPIGEIVNEALLEWDI